MNKSQLAHGSIFGILGGGPHAPLIAAAAQTLGFRPRMLDAHAEGEWAHAGLTGAPAEVRRIQRLARECAVVTAATEDIPLAILTAVADVTLTRPSLTALAIAQERRREREWLIRSGFPVLPWRPVETRDELLAAVAAFGGRAVVKPRFRRHPRLRPQMVKSPAEATTAWAAVRGVPCSVEPLVDIDFELTVLVACGVAGETRAYPAAVAVRDAGRLAWSILPAEVAGSPGYADVAAGVAHELGVVGLLAVEMFVLPDRTVVVNEIVPAPHAAFASSGDACVTGQYEQLVRCVAGLPLGATHSIAQTAAMPVFGGSGGTHLAGAIAGALGVEGVRTQIGDYGTEHSPAGFITARGATAPEAVHRLLEAAAYFDRAHVRKLSRHRPTMSANRPTRSVR